jgi:hypothetical protein
LAYYKTEEFELAARELAQAVGAQKQTSTAQSPGNSQVKKP